MAPSVGKLPGSNERAFLLRADFGGTRGRLLSRRRRRSSKSRIPWNAFFDILNRRVSISAWRCNPVQRTGAEGRLLSSQWSQIMEVAAKIYSGIIFPDVHPSTEPHFSDLQKAMLDA